MDSKYGCRVGLPVIRVKHSDLKLYSDTSAYRACCPLCTDGLLLVCRDPKQDYQLSRRDCCIVCGQVFYYTDEKIAGENLPPDEEEP
jgi:hypothetical protein